MLRLVEVPASDSDKLDDMVHRGRVAAAVSIPEDFSRRALAGSFAPMTVIAEEYDADGQVALRTIQSAAQRLTGSVYAARVALEK